jgi:hypothetical protein
MTSCESTNPKSHVMAGRTCSAHEAEDATDATLALAAAGLTAGDPVGGF